MSEPQEILDSTDVAKRVARPANHAAENRALRMLAAELEKPDGDVLGKLCDAAIELCGAHSAGISIIESDGVETVFRWHAVSGQWSKYCGGKMPRNASPCGTVVDRNEALLMCRPARLYPIVSEVEPEPVEGLLAPFHMLGEPVGTVWVVSHDESRKFDSEDVRVMESLAQVAAAAYIARVEINRANETRDEALRANERLRRANTRLSEKLGLY
ncbi:MAG: GAF domain-containing protein [Usitatibacter sp.]